MKMSEADRRYYRKLAKKLAKYDIPGESGEHHRNIYLSAATLAAKDPVIFSTADMVFMKADDIRQYVDAYVDGADVIAYGVWRERDDCFPGFLAIRGREVFLEIQATQQSRTIGVLGLPCEDRAAAELLREICRTKMN
jgi:hypothetical protein